MLSKKLYLRPIRYLALIIAATATLSCQQGRKNNSWVASFPYLGTNSSPRLADLTADGVPDIVLGSGRNEWEASDSAVIALDGADGHLLWHAAAPNQVVGSALFLDISADSVPDVIIGGRSTFLSAIDGRMGTVLWKYAPPQDSSGAGRFAHHNFYSPQLIADQTGDGLPDLLVPNGGNPRALANSSAGRDPGVLMILNSQTGAILSVAAMPDGQETYCSPLVHDFEQSGNPEVIFGTGGETAGGGLYRVPLADVVKGDLSGAKQLWMAPGHGFIAPPVLADVTADGIADIIATNQGGILLAFDGKDNHLLWKVEVPGAEASSSIAVGYFNRDETPDFFAPFSLGVWPENNGARQMFVDGRDGQILHEYSAGCTGFFSPVAVDLDQDGLDEVLMSVNEYRCDGIFVTDSEHYIGLFQPKDGSLSAFIPRQSSKNLSSTPWIGDMDRDGYLDIVYVLQANTARIIDFAGMAVLRQEFRHRVSTPPSWGGYMGNKGDGTFRGSPAEATLRRRSGS
ncbi:MAG: hypothetical protein EAZ89_01565 [Bacteroidetes bacterium]|nr:MAG: hypothetical protein EAZ89_01565 [Bacteroidota bacterium]